MAWPQNEQLREISSIVYKRYETRHFSLLYILVIGFGLNPVQATVGFEKVGATE